MKPILLTLCVLSALCGSLSADAPSSAKASRDVPNIVFIFADDWGWGDLGIHGHPYLKTPHLDRLAKEGTEFHQFTVNNPVCSPSRTAVMTGHYPARHGVHGHFATVESHVKRRMPDWLDPKATMLPRLLQGAGYATAHFGKWHLSNIMVPDAPLPDSYGYGEHGVFNAPGPQMPVHDDCDRAIAFAEKHKDRPFFINLWIHETHTPHYPKKEYLAQFAELGQQEQTYAAVVAHADARIGKLLSALKRLGLEDDTLVLFSSDNGPENTGSASRKRSEDRSTGPGRGTFYSVGSTAGLKGRKRSLHDGGVGVPFIVRWPGKVPAGKVDKTTVLTAVDLLPTLCEVAGVKLPAGYEPDGQNMLPAFLGEPVARAKPIFWEWRSASRGDNWPGLAVRDGEWKLLMTADRKRVELYQLPADRFEKSNVAKQYPEVRERLQKAVLDWQASLPKKIPTHCTSKLRNK
jgi:N-acetylgalactosamine-6-sulfatase